VYPWVLSVGWGVVIVVVVVEGVTRALGVRGIPWLAIMGYVPFLGGILKANLLARWLDALRLGIDSGLDLPRAMTLAAEATGEPSLIHDAAAVSEQLERGLPLAGFATRRIPASVTAAIELASTTGSGSELSSVLVSLSRMYEEQAEHRLRVLPSILTPLSLLLLAAVVCLTIGAMFLPLLKLIQSVSGGGWP
jgi:type II secretory pathway component PulF